MASFNIVPPLFCPACQAYISPHEVVCTCGWERPETYTPPPEHGKPLWNANLPGPARARLVPAGELLLCPWGRRGSVGGVVAFDLASGEQRWAFDTPFAVEGGLTVADDRLYFGTLSHMGLGEGALLYCLNLVDGALVWKRELPGGVWSPPVIFEVRLFVACDSGQLLCLDVRNSEMLPQWSAQFERGRLWLLKKEDRLVALNEHGQIGLVRTVIGSGQRLRSKKLNVDVTSPPALAGNKIVFGAEGGMLLEVDLEDFAMRVLVQGYKRIVAQPVFEDDKVFVGAHDHRLHAWDLQKGVELWQGETGIEQQNSICRRSISAPPVLGDGLAAVADLSGRVYTYDIQTGEILWTFDLTGRQPIFSGLAFFAGVFYVGDESGQITALPWHLGRYQWAAECLYSQGQFEQAGNYFALAAHNECIQERQSACFQGAIDSWKADKSSERGEMLERTAALQEYLIQPEQAAETWLEAGRNIIHRNRKEAAQNFQRAADIFFRINHADRLNEASRLLASCARLPYIEAHLLNVPTFCEREMGEISLRLTNEKWSAVPEGIKFWIGGALKIAVEVQIPGQLEPYSYWTIPIKVTPTRPRDMLIFEYEYQTGSTAHPWLRGILSIPIEANPASPEPSKTYVGDVSGTLIINIDKQTQEGVQIETRDVGLIRSSDGIGQVNVDGDAGAVISHGGIQKSNIGGDVGLHKR